MSHRSRDGEGIADRCTGEREIRYIGHVVANHQIIDDRIGGLVHPAIEHRSIVVIGTVTIS